ncbi:hypothetical protein MA785_000844 [Vibrio parahaemolyticus]|nr:hypothetical protein [Vibrio parahaemolyticus]EJR2787953.1 hypothetical protein [Vibrio parahaemolyticus]
MEEKIFYILKGRLTSQTEFLEQRLGCVGEQGDFYTEYDNAEYSKEKFLSDFLKREANRLEQWDHEEQSIYLSVNDNGLVMDDMDGVDYSPENSSMVIKFNQLSLVEQQPILQAINAYNQLVEGESVSKAVKPITPSTKHLLDDAAEFLKNRFAEKSPESVLNRVSKNKNRVN